MGITGLDLFREADLDDRRARLVLDDLGFGSANLVVGVPVTWIDVDSMADLLDVAHDMRQKRGRPLLVATKFPNLARKHFLGVGLTDFRIVQSLGATEAAPQTGSADVVVDLVSTGRTFANNGLKTLTDGLVLKTQACLVASGTASRWNNASRDAFRHLGELLGAGLKARTVRTILALFDKPLEEVPQEVATVLEDARIYRSLVGPHELRGTVSLDSLHEFLFETRRAGASSVEIAEPNIILEHDFSRVEAFLDFLDR
jgi:ATP phosphoribosyltransferase